MMLNVLPGELVLVTGVTGSLGSALIPRLLMAGARVRGMSRDEAKQDVLHRRYPEVDFRLGDVRDAAACRTIMQDVETVIHGASLKYVDVSELQPREYVQTNVLGTMNIIAASQWARSVRRVIGISTDKACLPRNTYGLTKALLEKLFLGAHGTKTFISANLGASVYHDSPAYVVCRYGNVFATRGSVIPKWSELRKKGERLLVTNPEMTRFFFSMDDAIHLIDQALVAPSGQFVLQAMPSATLGQVAALMAPTPGAATVVGMRPGEKVHEDLLAPHEMARTHRVGDLFFYDPSAAPVDPEPAGYTSFTARRLEDAELLEWLAPWL